MMTEPQIMAMRSRMSQADREEWDRLIAGWTPPIWTPFPGPQTLAYHSTADQLFYGGGAGGGKSDLLLGLAITSQRKSLILRRESTQLTDIVGRSQELLAGKADFNGSTRVWRNIPGQRSIEFGGCEHLEDRQKYKGRPHDLKGFDEGTDFLEAQFDFITAWNRTSTAGQRCRIVLTGNPPSTAEGEWVIRRWGPWIDPNYHGKRALPGELRWYARIEGKEIEVESGQQIEHKGDSVKPYSRTFVPALVTDNPVLMATGYQQTLDMLPEPLRSMLKKGDFAASIQDDEWQVIPTAWVQAAMARWTPDGRDTYLDALGVDVARGGKDKTTLAKRYGNWIGELIYKAGKTTPDGQAVLRLILEALDDDAGVHHATVHIDATGVGTSPADLGRAEGLRINPVIFAAATNALDRAGMLRMRNWRAWLWWNMRDMLDPDRGDDIALPKDQELLSDLTAPRWKMTASGVQIEDKDEIIKRIGRSPDAAEAVILACCPWSTGTIETGKMASPRQSRMFGRR